MLFSCRAATTAQLKTKFSAICQLEIKQVRKLSEKETGSLVMGAVIVRTGVHPGFSVSIFRQIIKKTPLEIEKMFMAANRSSNKNDFKRQTCVHTRLKHTRFLKKWEKYFQYPCEPDTFAVVPKRELLALARVRQFSLLTSSSILTWIWRALQPIYTFKKENGINYTLLFSFHSPPHLDLLPSLSLVEFLLNFINYFNCTIWRTLKSHLPIL